MWKTGLSVLQNTCKAHLRTSGISALLFLEHPPAYPKPIKRPVPAPGMGMNGGPGQPDAAKSAEIRRAVSRRPSSSRLSSAPMGGGGIAWHESLCQSEETERSGVNLAIMKTECCSKAHPCHNSNNVQTQLICFPSVSASTYPNQSVMGTGLIARAAPIASFSRSR